jgi:hypothetical protein
MIGVSVVKMTGIAIVMSAVTLGSTIRVQGTVFCPCNGQGCDAGGCYSCNGTRQVGQYTKNGQTCTILQACTVNCPQNGDNCPSWGNPYYVPSSCTG